MTYIYGASGGSITINVRRSESRDAHQIMKLFAPSTNNMFGRINILHLLERANLAVTVENEKNEVIAHAAFLDYPNVKSVEQNNWEPWLHMYGNSSKCTPLNTLFMHLFVAKPDFAAGCAREIIRTVFNAVQELHFIILSVEKKVDLDPALSLLFIPLPQFKKMYGVQCLVTVCYRKDYVPVLHIRKARIEDRDDITPIFNEMTDTLRTIYGEYFLAELIEAQDEMNHAAVCEVNNTAVGFISLCSEVNVELLNNCFDLRPFHGLRKGPSEKLNALTLRTAKSPVKEDILPSHSEDNADEKKEETNQDETNRAPHSDIRNQVTERAENSQVVSPRLTDAPNVFCIQLFCMDEKYETRSQDFLPYIFNLYPDRDFCIMTVPHVVPEFPLLKEFVRVVPYSKTTLSHELYVTHRKGLLKSFVVRLATFDDTKGIELLVRSLELQHSILADLSTYNQSRRDVNGTPIQVIVADVLSEIVGIAVIRNEENIEYIRSHYNIENFIYFNHHQREEHGHLYHFALNPIFYHYTRHFLKEILRITLKSCLYYPVYPKSSQNEVQSPHVHSLTSALHFLVPVRRRRQIIYPLEQLGINAPSKRITKEKVPYLTGADTKSTNKDVIVDPDKQFSENVPPNFFLLNNHNDCENALDWLKNHSENTKGNIIVYGSTIEAYITINTILSFGIDGSLIHLVKPPTNSNSNCFNSSLVETAVEEALEKAKVSVHSNCLLSQWNDGKVHGQITVSTFTTESEPLILRCVAFFNFDKKKVDYDAFKAINKACLVFDGKLVIDSTFHTNDITIRSAGPLTKYSRRYYADQWSHENFNSKEIGFQLAALMLHLFDPTLEQVTQPPAELDLLVPTYTGCKVKECILPGDYHYLHVSKPGPMTCLDIQKGKPEYGRDIVTGSPSTGNYFQIHLNKYSTVDSITCLSLTPLPVSNYICLYGQHERLLNNLCSRFDEGLISDLYSYLKEPWSLCIYHDRFMEFKQEVRQLVESEKFNVTRPIEELIRQIADGELLVPENTKEFLEKQFQKHGYQKLIERSLLNYLRYNSDHLPMFAWPGVV
ncbi:cilia- and flagella-associated protein 61 isoform X6 [Narcine bancroftii]|uniref:cilia- and flagella-associated protein 61 isoform X6 n=1 Tax=Narcine bancroftii TaxID=1343680 RepID=UPI0038319364